jgi:hypothetical protein
LTDAEHVQVYEKLVSERPLAFQAALTVTPETFAQKKCVKLFKNYKDIPISIEYRFGHTFPLANIREWFDTFAAAVWEKVEVVDV